jgi:hypothetical protein
MPAYNLVNLADQIRAAHVACEGAFQAGLDHAIKAGEMLLRAKARVPHGRWTSWVEEHCEITARLAQKYMQVAREWPELQRRNDPNTPRVAASSFRQALAVIADNGTTARQVVEAAPAAIGELLDYADAHGRHQTLGEALVSQRRERDRQARQAALLREIQDRRQARGIRQQAEEPVSAEEPFFVESLGEAPSDAPPARFNAEGGFLLGGQARQAAVEEIRLMIQAAMDHVEEDILPRVWKVLARHHGGQAADIRRNLADSFSALAELLSAI